MKKCGINQTLIKQYDFNDHIWYINKQDPYFSDLLHLAYRAVKIDSKYWMKKAGGVHWIGLGTQSDAEKEAVNTWTGATLPSGNVIDSQLISTFFTGDKTDNKTVGTKVISSKVKVGSCPNIYQKMVVPMGPAFVTYDHQHYLNTWYNDMITADANDLPVGKAILIMIYGGLCNGTVDRDNIAAEGDRIYNMVVTDTYDNVEFRFLINWLAAIVQMPGINLQTNVWLLGTLEGIGKGTLVDLMGWIIGREFVGKLNQTEIEGGWNDHLVGKQLIEINEFDTDGKMSPKAWRSWIKSHTIEPRLKVRQRNTSAYNVLHIGNFIGTSNVEDQSFVDTHDRRNQFIKTSDDPFWVQYATGVQLKHFKPHPEKTASGFAVILEQVQVDLEFIGRSFNNAFRQTIVVNNQSIIEEWESNDSTIQKDVWKKSTDFYEDYKKWFRVANPDGRIPSITAWGRAMGRCEYMGIKKRRTPAGVEYIFGKPQQIYHPVSLEQGVDALNQITGDNTKIVVYDLDEPDDRPDFSALTPMEKMREHLRKLKTD